MGGCLEPAGACRSPTGPSRDRAGRRLSRAGPGPGYLVGLGLSRLRPANGGRASGACAGGRALGGGRRGGRCALGGRYFAKGVAEVRFPLGLPGEFDVRGRLFADFGTLWGADGPDSGADDDKGSIRVSVGPGVTWNSPLGLINIDLGYAVRKKDYDRTELLNFSIGTTF